MPEQLAQSMKTMITTQEQLITTLTQVITNQEHIICKLRKLAERIPDVIESNVTPSQACSSGAPAFDIVLQWLRLPLEIPFMDRVTDAALDEGTYPTFAGFDWGDQNKNAGYEPMRDFFASCGLISRNVANGLNNLYDFSVLSPRDRLADGLTLRDENTINKFRIYGKPDIVVLDEDILTRGCMKFAIEIKTVVDMDTEAKTNEALREAFLQLVGLNVRNVYKSPAVVLTDMNQKHYVLYLDIYGDPEALRYALKIYQSSELNRIFHFATQIGKQSHLTGRLGDEMTLRTLLARPVNEEEGNFGNVSFIIKPLADLDGLGEEAAIEEEHVA